MSRPLYTTDIKNALTLPDISNLGETDFIIVATNNGFRKISGDNISTDTSAISGDVSAQIENIRTTVVTVSSAFAQEIENLNATFTSISSLSAVADITEFKTVFASITGSFAQQFTDIEAEFITTSSYADALYNQTLTAIANEESARTTQYENLYATFQSISSLSAAAVAEAEIDSLETAFADLSSAVASQTTSLQASFDDFSSEFSAVTAEVTTYSSAIASLSGYASASYGVEINASGAATGFRLIDDSAGTSSFTISADSFVVQGSSGNQMYYDSTDDRLVLEDGLIQGGEISIGTGSKKFFVSSDYLAYGEEFGILFQTAPVGGNAAIGINMGFSYDKDGMYLISYDAGSGGTEQYNEFSMGSDISGGSNSYIKLTNDHSASSKYSKLVVSSNPHEIEIQSWNEVCRILLTKEFNSNEIKLINSSNTNSAFIEINGAGTNNGYWMNGKKLLTDRQPDWSVGDTGVNSDFTKNVTSAGWNSTGYNLDWVANIRNVNSISIGILANLLGSLIVDLRDKHGLLGE